MTEDGSWIPCLPTDLVEEGYVLTIDNMLKMVSIQQRLAFGLPVIIMGETGCGKSSLIRNLCGIFSLQLYILDVHGGMEDQDIIEWVTNKLEIYKERRYRNKMVLFFDEVNTCNSMGLFKEMVCDHSLNGIPLPSDIKVIAACNPYRLRFSKNLYGGEEMAGLIFEHFVGGDDAMENVGTGIKDPLRNLVYRVHPLPESMIDYIFDFGALTAETEKQYIRAMLKRILNQDAQEVMEEEQQTVNQEGQEHELLVDDDDEDDRNMRARLRGLRHQRQQQQQREERHAQRVDEDAHLYFILYSIKLLYFKV
jgi:energy-coupling factor transporter ATP-binding protein EcfA2